MSDLDRVRTQRLMGATGIDALVFLQPEAFRYAIGAHAGVATMWGRAACPTRSRSWSTMRAGSSSWSARSGGDDGPEKASDHPWSTPERHNVAGGHGADDRHSPEAQEQHRDRITAEDGVRRQ